MLKLIALITMLTDHIACVFGWEGWDVLPFNISILDILAEYLFRFFHLINRIRAAH